MGHTHAHIHVCATYVCVCVCVWYLCLSKCHAPESLQNSAIVLLPFATRASLLFQLDSYFLLTPRSLRVGVHAENGAATRRHVVSCGHLETSLAVYQSTSLPVCPVSESQNVL